jgi:type IV pilus assembly protein PilA
MNSSPTQRREDKGFTLIELMVVVLIIAILLAIAIPTFLGAQNKAKDRSAQSSARNALTNAKTIFADTGVYSDVTVAKLTASEPSLTFVATASTTPKTVSMVSTATAWYGAVLSDTGTCFYIVDSVGPTGTAGTSYAKVDITGTATCTASATSPAASAYSDKW